MEENIAILMATFMELLTGKALPGTITGKVYRTVRKAGKVEYVPEQGAVV